MRYYLKNADNDYWDGSAFGSKSNALQLDAAVRQQIGDAIKSLFTVDTVRWVKIKNS